MIAICQSFWGLFGRRRAAPDKGKLERGNRTEMADDTDMSWNGGTLDHFTYIGEDYHFKSLSTSIDGFHDRLRVGVGEGVAFARQ